MSPPGHGHVHADGRKIQKHNASGPNNCRQGSKRKEPLGLSVIILKPATLISEVFPFGTRGVRKWRRQPANPSSNGKMCDSMQEQQTGIKVKKVNNNNNNDRLTAFDPGQPG